MARLLRRFVEPPRECVYLPEKRASLDNRVMLDVTPEEFEAMLVRGWRRFGPFYFRHACPGCDECVSIRIPVDRFEPSQTQRRTWKRGSAALRARVGVPIVDAARLELYGRWHSMREEVRGWAPSAQDAESYALEFAYPHPCAREISYWDDAAPGGPRLVGVGLCDQTPSAFSAIYFYYDPDYMRWSPGVFNVLFQIEHARSLGIPHVYLGYRVEGCASMRYKATFRPHQLLRGRPAFHEEPPWADAPPAGPERGGT